MILKYIPVLQALISSVTVCVHNEMSFVVAPFTPSPNSNTVSVWPGLGLRLRLNRGWGGKWTQLVNSETLKTSSVGFRFCTWADSLSCRWLNEGFRPFQTLSEYEDVRKEISSRVMSRKKSPNGTERQVLLNHGFFFCLSSVIMAKSRYFTLKKSHRGSSMSNMSLHMVCACLLSFHWGQLRFLCVSFGFLGGWFWLDWFW